VSGGPGSPPVWPCSCHWHCWTAACLRRTRHRERERLHKKCLVHPAAVYVLGAGGRGGCAATTCPADWLVAGVGDGGNYTTGGWRQRCDVLSATQDKRAPRKPWPPSPVIVIISQAASMFSSAGMALGEDAWTG
jgi:hypothetical protein